MTKRRTEPDRESIARQLRRSVGALTTSTVTRMERDMAWFRDLSAEDRSWIGLIVQSGIKAFVTWYEEPVGSSSPVTAEVFGAAPRALAGVVSLHQTVEMVRLTIEVVEENVVEAVGTKDAPAVREAIARYAREVAFATAEVYARAAEMRGAWDARLEALVVDSVLRAEADEAVLSRASALGWESRGAVAVVFGLVPGGSTGRGREGFVDEVRRSARRVGMDALCAVQGDRLVVVLGGVQDRDKAAAAVVDHFGTGPVVIGPLVSDLARASVSARAAMAGLRAAPGWPAAPRPVTSDDLLPERALAGDGLARRELVTEVYQPLLEAGPAVLETVAAFLDNGGSIEGTGRALFVHPNTVRYRLRRATDATGLSPTDPRQAYTYRMALTLGRLNPPERSL